MTLKFNAKIQFSSDKENSSIYHSINTDNEFYPENPELPYWAAVTLASKGNLDQALPIFWKVFKKEPRLRILTPRLVNSGLLPDDPELIEAIIQIRSK